MATSNRTLELTLKVVVAASQELQRLKSELQSLANLKPDGVASGFDGIGQAADNAGSSVENIRKGIFGLGGATGALAAISTGFGAISAAIQTAIGLAQQFYGSTIGAAEALNAQLLSSQTNLASATRIFQGGIELTDPTAKINASRKGLEQAIQTIQKETQSLVGVTSGQVNELFQITLTNAAELNNQAKGLDASINDPIKAATTLTKGWAASLKVIGVPLDQARQEINSILKGQIDNNSILAKNLNISSQQVNQWKAQGTLVTELNNRLETFVAGNAIAANSIDGVFSNIKDVIEIILRDVSKPFLQPIISGLSAVFNLLNSSQQSILDFSNGVASQILEIGNSLAPAFAAFQPTFEALGASLVNLGVTIIPLIIGGLKNVLQVVGTVGQIIAPVINGVAGIVKGITDFAKTDIGKIAIQVGAVTAAFALLAPLVTAAIPAAIATLTTSLIPALLSALASVPAAISTIAASATSLPSIFAAISGAVAGLPALLAAATTAALPLAAALAPLAGAVAITFIVKGTQDMKVAQEQIDALNDSSNRLADESLNYATKLKALSEAQKAGTITPEQQKALQTYSKLAADNSKAIDSQIASLQAIQPANQEQKNAIDAQIASLKQRQALMEKFNTLEFRAQGLAELGNSYDQLKEKAENAQRAIADGGGGDPERFKKAADDLIKITQQQVELGQISEAEAQKRLQQIANDTRVEVETQQQAQEAIAKIREQGNKNDLANIDQQIKAVESQIKNREITEVAGAQRITELKRQQLQQQLKDIEEAIAAEQQAIASGTGSKTRLDELTRQQADVQRQLGEQARAGAEAVAKAETDAKKRELDVQRANLEAQLAQIDALRSQGQLSEEQAAVKVTEIKRQQLQIQLQDIQAQIAQAQAANDPTKVAQLEAQATKVRADIQKQSVDAQKQVFEAKLKDFDEKEKKATEVVKVAEAERKAEIDKQVAAGTLTREQAESKKLELVKQSIQKEIEEERKKIAVIQAIQASTPDAQKQKDARLLESRKKLADLTSRLAENEIAQQEKLKQAAQKSQDEAEQRALKAIEERAKAIQNQYAAQKFPLQEQLNLFEAINKAISNQNTLLGAQKDLISASKSLMQSQYDIAIGFAESEEEANQLRLEQAQAEYEALQQTFEIERLSLQIEQQKTKILLEQEKIKLRIQLIDAQSAADQAKNNVQKLKAQGASKEEIKGAEADAKSADQKVRALGQQSVLLQEQEQTTDRLFDLQNQALDKRQRDQGLQARAKIAKLTDSKDDDIAIKNEAIAGARQSRVDISREQSSQIGLQKASLAANQERVNSVLQPLTNPTQPGVSAGGSQAGKPQVATLAPMSAFNIFVESGKEAKLGKQIGDRLFQSFSNVIKQASTGKAG